MRRSLTISTSAVAAERVIVLHDRIEAAERPRRPRLGATVTRVMGAAADGLAFAEMRLVKLRTSRSAVASRGRLRKTIRMRRYRQQKIRQSGRSLHERKDE